MGIGDQPLRDWLEGAAVENSEEVEEIMSDLLGDNLTLKELSPGRLDDDALAEVLEALDLEEEATASAG